jgi:GNAT superfamily N-acetyltransferase
MVRRLERRDLERLDAFLRQRLPSSFPILGDIERSDTREHGGELWGWFAQDELRAVLAHTATAACVCGPDECAVDELSGVLAGFDGLAELDGNFETVAPYAGRVSLGASHRQHMAYLQPGSFSPRYSKTLEVRRAAPSDAERIAELWCRRLVADYRDRTVELLRGRLVSSADRIYLARLQGLLVSTASTGKESPSVALIRCTYTEPDLRDQGYAVACLSVLCRDLLAEGKTVVVLTETLADARIYRKVGFVPAGLWAECRRK